MMDGQEILADDLEFAAGQKMMDVGDAAVLRILDRDHRPLGAAFAHGGEDILERDAWQSWDAGKHRPAGHVGIRPQRALEGDRSFDSRHYRSNSARARSRSAWVSTPNGTVS